MSIAKFFTHLALMSAMSSGGESWGSEQSRDRRNPSNPHNFPRFETEGFVTYSINQASHDAKYSKWLKKKK